MTNTMISYVVVVGIVLAFIKANSCLPTNLLNSAELGDMTHILLPAGAEKGYEEDDILDREERGLPPSGSGSGPVGPLTGLTDDEDLVTDGGGRRTDDEDVNQFTQSRQLSNKPEVLKMAVVSRITARFSSTEVRSKIKNMAKEAAETNFTIKLPEDAFISAFSVIIDDIVYHSEVKPKDVAQTEYNEAKAKGQTAGQVKQCSPDDTKFCVSITIEAHASVVFNLTYQQLLRRKDCIFEQKISILPGQMVPDVRVEVHITEPQGLREVNAKWAVADKSDEMKLNSMTSTEYKLRSAKVLFDSKGDGRLIASNGIMGDFIVTYDVVHDVRAGNLQIVNGYFVHYFSPEGLPKTRKNVVFVIDVSGSMNGRKIEQTKSALTTILDDVRPIDRINIVLFASDVRVWRANEMVEASGDNILAAKEHVNRIYASGQTNLYGGLTAAVDLLLEQGTNDALPLIIMLTDGEPTSGSVRSTSEIVRRITALIEGRISLFSVGFGDGVDFSFLEKLSLSNQALARKVYEDSSASMQMKGFYDEAANPLLFNINIEYSHDLVDKNSLTQTNYRAYYDGTEIIVAGKLKDDVINAIWNIPNQTGVLRRDPEGAEGENRDMSHRVRNETTLASTQRPETIFVADGNEAYDIDNFCAVITGTSLDVDIEFNTSTTIEKERTLRRHEVDDFAQRLWAYLTIKNLLKQNKTADDPDIRVALSERALNLSLKYHFVTPLTSLFVVKPDMVVEGRTVDHLVVPLDDITPIVSHVSLVQDHAVVPISAQPQNNRLSFVQTAVQLPNFMIVSTPTFFMSYADSDPHFLVEVPDSGLTVCFDINGEPGDVFNLFDDPILNLRVSAYVIPIDQTGTPDPNHRNNTYFGKIGVLLGLDRYLVLTPDIIEVNNDAFKLGWEEPLAMRVGDFIVQIKNKHQVVIAHGDDVVVVVMAHRVKHGDIFQYERERAAANRTRRIDHLGFYVVEGKGLSKNIHGLIGQFYQNRDVLLSEPIPDAMDPLDDTPLPLSAPGQNATLSIDDRQVPVKLMTRRIPLVKDYKECWHAADNAKGLIEGDYADYKLPYLNARPTA